ncbi:MAG: recombination mediator RecR [bacterium]
MEAFENAVDRLRRLPGIGKKSARRLVFHLLTVAESEVEKLTNALMEARNKLGYCPRCGNLSEKGLCNICRDQSRSSRQLCVVADPEDIFTIENAGDFQGKYHVLGGLISPLDGIGPDQLNIASLVRRIENDQENIKEIVFAFNPTNEGEVTINYLKKRLDKFDLQLSHLGYGIPVGSNIEYTDQMTLSKAFENRVYLENEGEI